jgi:NAD(P)H-nitrite reductase large subunit
MKRYVIIGMGAAGFAAAQTIRAHDPGGEIVLISPENAGYYSRPALAYYLSKEINEGSLYPLTKAEFKELGIITLKDLVVRIDPELKSVFLKSQKKIAYDRLLMAPGAEAVQPTMEGIDLEGVYYLDSHAQTKELVKRAKRGRTAVVAGGGITALEIVEGLSARKMKVHFFLRGDLYWNRVLDPVESEIILRRLEEDGVIIHKNTEVVSLSAERSKLSRAHTNQGDSLEIDLAAFAIGVKPRVSLAAASGVEIQRGIKVNPFMETNLESIYAAGDAAEVYDPQSGTWVVDSLWHIARQQGITAGRNMAGARESYQRRIPINVTRLAGLTTTIIGMVGNQAPEDECSIVRGESESWQLMPDAVICQNNFDVNRLRLMVGQDRILGAVLIGDQSLSQTIEELVTRQVNIEPIRSLLLKSDVNLAKVLVEFWQTRNPSHV